MMRRLLTPVWFALLASSCAGVSHAANASAPAPATQTMDAAAVKRLFDPWKAPVPPRRLIGNIHYVGAIGVSSFLIATPAGHILIDTGFAETVPLIERGVKQLGFRAEDIKFILSSHAHIDHTGGHAAMKRITGATVCASAADARVLESGGRDDFIPFPPSTIVYEPVHVDRIIGEGDTVALGGTILTAHLTPGHTKGATTWTMEVHESNRVYHVVFFSSASVNPGTPLLHNPKYPGIVDDLTATFAKLKTLPCDIFFAPHAAQFAMIAKFEQLDRGVKDPYPLVDPDGWKRLIISAEQSFQQELARQRAAAKP